MSSVQSALLSLWWAGVQPLPFGVASGAVKPFHTGVWGVHTGNLLVLQRPSCSLSVLGRKASGETVSYRFQAVHAGHCKYTVLGLLQQLVTISAGRLCFRLLQMFSVLPSCSPVRRCFGQCLNWGPFVLFFSVETGILKNAMVIFLSETLT